MSKNLNNDNQKIIDGAIGLFVLFGSAHTWGKDKSFFTSLIFMVVIYFEQVQWFPGDGFHFFTCFIAIFSGIAIIFSLISSDGSRFPAQEIPLFILASLSSIWLLFAPVPMKYACKINPTDSKCQEFNRVTALKKRDDQMDLFSKNGCTNEKSNLGKVDLVRYLFPPGNTTFEFARKGYDQGSKFGKDVSVGAWSTYNHDNYSSGNAVVVEITGIDSSYPDALPSKFHSDEPRRSVISWDDCMIYEGTGSHRKAFAKRYVERGDWMGYSTEIVSTSKTMNFGNNTIAKCIEADSVVSDKKHSHLFCEGAGLAYWEEYEIQDDAKVRNNKYIVTSALRQSLNRDQMIEARKIVEKDHDGHELSAFYKKLYSENAELERKPASENLPN